MRRIIITIVLTLLAVTLVGIAPGVLRQSRIHKNAFNPESTFQEYNQDSAALQQALDKRVGRDIFLPGVTLEISGGRTLIRLNSEITIQYGALSIPALRFTHWRNGLAAGGILEKNDTAYYLRDPYLYVIHDR